MEAQKTRIDVNPEVWNDGFAVAPAIVWTSTVLVVDVFVIWLLHHTLLKIGAFLTLRQVLDKKKPVRISEMWFEHFTGRTHGPLWFRYTQAVLKTVVFAAAVTLSLCYFDRP